jgi:hypothetical protein
MVDIIELSRALTITDRSDPHLMQNTRSGGMALDGGEQVLSPLSSRWEWSISIPVVTEAHARSMRVFRTKAKGNFNYLRIPLCDKYRITRKQVGAQGPDESVPFSDGSYFSDGSGYALVEPTSPVLVAAVEGAETIVIEAAPLNGAMTAGVFISINDWLYHIDEWVEDEADDTRLILTISPPLREPVAVDDLAEFAATALWVMDQASAARLELQVGKFGGVNITLLEPVGRRLDAS